MKHTNKKHTPTITWQPCNPVNIKKADGYTPSCKLNVDSKYSKPCKNIKNKPKNIVSINPSIESLKDPKLIALCTQVTLKPDIIKTKVLNNGNSKTGITLRPTGGHIVPTSIDGHNAEWKNAQKKPKNNIISDVIKNKKPNFNPCLTIFVW